VTLSQGFHVFAPIVHLVVSDHGSKHHSSVAVQ